MLYGLRSRVALRVTLVRLGRSGLRGVSAFLVDLTLLLDKTDDDRR